MAPGTATNFSRLAAPARRRSRALLAAANLTVLPPEGAPPAAGSTFLPTCPAARPCNTAAVVDAFAPGGAAAVVAVECVPVARISEAAAVVAGSLANDTLYRVTLVTSDLAGHAAAWGALVRTQDLTPPVLTVLEQPPPRFTAFEVTVALNEPGTIYAGLEVEGATSGPPAPGCPPTFQVRRGCTDGAHAAACGPCVRMRQPRMLHAAACMRQLSAFHFSSCIPEHSDHTPLSSTHSNRPPSWWRPRCWRPPRARA